MVGVSKRAGVDQHSTARSDHLGVKGHLMTNQVLPDPKTLRKLLRYEPETGEFFWRARDVSFFKTEGHCKMWNKRYAEKPAGSIRGDGYIIISLSGRDLLAHRIAWATRYNAWPTDQLDHVNGDRADNRIVNLREVTQQENGKNQKTPCTNTSGIMGVTWYKRGAKWRAQIVAGGKYISIGYFSNIEDAAAARAKAEVEHDFHENHGRT